MGVLDDSQRLSLEQRLQVWRSSGKLQLQIVFLQNLDGLPIEEYSIKLAEMYQFGDKQKDNGIIFLVSFQDRKMRLEVGQGLEGAITDAHSARILREVKEYFNHKQFFDGIVFVSNAVYQLVLQEMPDDQLGAGGVNYQSSATSSLSKRSVFEKIIIFLFFFKFQKSFVYRCLNFLFLLVKV